VNVARILVGVDFGSFHGELDGESWNFHSEYLKYFAQLQKREGKNGICVCGVLRHDLMSF
jgi:recombinational DNA repair ATPase RecF